MAKCSYSDISLYADKMLGREEMEAVGTHIDVCYHCRNYYHEIKRNKAILGSVPTYAPPQYIRENVYSYIGEITDGAFDSSDEAAEMPQVNINPFKRPSSKFNFPPALMAAAAGFVVIVILLIRGFGMNGSKNNVVTVAKNPAVNSEISNVYPPREDRQLSNGVDANAVAEDKTPIDAAKELLLDEKQKKVDEAAAMPVAALSEVSEESAEAATQAEAGDNTEAAKTAAADSDESGEGQTAAAEQQPVATPAPTPARTPAPTPSLTPPPQTAAATATVSSEPTKSTQTASAPVDITATYNNNGNSNNVLEEYIRSFSPGNYTASAPVEEEEEKKEEKVISDEVVFEANPEVVY